MIKTFLNFEEIRKTGAVEKKIIKIVEAHPISLLK